MLFRAVSLALVLAGALPPPQAPHRSPRPAPGVFLVARDAIEDGPFWQSVVLIVSHGAEGTLGVMVNRASDVTLGEVLPELEEGETTPHRVHFGGPVALEGLVFLFRAGEPPEDATHVFEDVYFDGRLETLKRVLAEKDAVKVFLGHAGWAPGQLDAEIARGSWDVVPADAFSLFGRDPALLWPELSGSGRTVARVAPHVRFADTVRPHPQGGS